MKELSYLNKYFFKYKRYLLLGILFIIISNIFQIIPAQLVRRALDLVIDNIRLYKLFEGLKLQESFYGIFTESVFFYALLILVFNYSRPLITLEPFTSSIKISDDRYKKQFSRFL